MYARCGLKSFTTEAVPYIFSYEILFFKIPLYNLEIRKWRVKWIEGAIGLCYEGLFGSK